MIKQPKGVWCEVDCSTDCSGYWSDLKDLDIGNLAFGSEFGQGQGGGQACDTSSQNDDVEALRRCRRHDGMTVVVLLAAFMVVGGENGKLIVLRGLRDSGDGRAKRRSLVKKGEKVPILTAM